MLIHLFVENYALIEKLDISFNEGLTVVTGETGAGKSIMLGALGLILGQRADTQALLHKDNKCIVEGTFELSQIPIKDLFDLYQLDYDNLSCFRREITPQGKSRAFVNDTPVNLNVLKELADRLIDIHSQHQNLLLGNSSFQFDVVDSYSAHMQKVQEYRLLYAKWNTDKTTLNNLVAAEVKSRADLDYFRFLLDELEKSQLIENDYAQIESELEIIGNAETIKRSLEKAGFIFTGADFNIIAALNEAYQALKPIGRFNSAFLQLCNRVESVVIEIKDLSNDLSREAESVSFDPQRANVLQQRFDLLNKLLAKHNAKTIPELITIREELQTKIQAIDTLEGQIGELQKSIHQTEEELLTRAREMSRRRMEVIPQIDQEITAQCKQLGMPGARFVIHCTQLETPTTNGIDKISFLFNANVGGEPGEIAKIASGGELSRLMLSIKSSISQRNLLPTIIFDEIDSGISGQTANQVGMILEKISQSMQVLAITHLPQIASRGKSHLVVQKIIEQGKTRTEITPIGHEQRVAEVAKMLGGTNPSGAMLETAREFFLKSSNN